MELTTVWFVLIAILWAGYFVLEGFDFGVGMLLAVLGQDDRERRVLINTIGPVWDGNEVWLLVAGGATFAAFPEWYATLFSGFYLPLLLILVALIVRGRRPSSSAASAPRPRGAAGGTSRSSSARSCPALLWGVALANIVRGVPIDADARVRRRLLRPAQPVRAARRTRHADAVPVARRVLRGAQDRRRDPGAGRSLAAAARRPSRRVAGGRVRRAGPALAQDERVGVGRSAWLAAVALVGRASWQRRAPGRLGVRGHRPRRSAWS